jgi:hypothetical protein
MILCMRKHVGYITGPTIVVLGTAFGISTVELWEARRDFAFGDIVFHFSFGLILAHGRSWVLVASFFRSFCLV